MAIDMVKYRVKNSYIHGWYIFNLMYDITIYKRSHVRHIFKINSRFFYGILSVVKPECG